MQQGNEMHHRPFNGQLYRHRLPPRSSPLLNCNKIKKGIFKCAKRKRRQQRIRVTCAPSSEECTQRRAWNERVDCKLKAADRCLLTAVHGRGRRKPSGRRRPDDDKVEGMMKMTTRSKSARNASARYTDMWQRTVEQIEGFGRETLWCCSWRSRVNWIGCGSFRKTNTG